MKFLLLWKPNWSPSLILSMTWFQLIMMRLVPFPLLSFFQGFVVFTVRSIYKCLLFYKNMKANNRVIIVWGDQTRAALLNHVDLVERLGYVDTEGGKH